VKGDVGNERGGISRRQKEKGVEFCARMFNCVLETVGIMDAFGTRV
jgi:hypothetical protein